MNQITPVVKQLLIVNVILFVGTFLVPELTSYFALYYPENPNFRIWQVITHMFMHGGFMHILFNMFALYSFGSVLEHYWGGKKFLLFYILCGLGAAVLHTAVNYWQVHDVVGTLVLNGFNEKEIFELLQAGRIDLRWQEYVTAGGIQTLGSSYL